MVAMRRLPELFDVVGVVEPDSKWRDRRGGMEAYKDLPWLTETQLLSIPGLAAVTVETDGHDLVSTAQRAADAGLHIHMDKPGGESLAPFARLIQTCQQSDLTLQMGYMYRYNPAIQFCLRAATLGWLGEIFEFHAVMSRFDGDNDDYRQWLAGFHGGVMYIFGGHLLDIAILFLGAPDRVVPYQRKTRDDGLFDNGLAVLEYPRATATIRTSVAEVDGMKHRRLIVCGTRGTVEICPLEPPSSRYTIDPLVVRLTLLEDNEEYAAGTHLVPTGPMEGRYEPQMREFAQIVRGQTRNPYSLEHELLVQKTLLTASGYGSEADSASAK
jgi:predicted dehydrogenase